MQPERSWLLAAAQLLRERSESAGILARYTQVETEQREQTSRSLRDAFTSFEKRADTLGVLRGRKMANPTLITSIAVSKTSSPGNVRSQAMKCACVPREA